MTRLLEVDDRRCTTLHQIGRHSRYLAAELPDGTVVLHPAVVMSEVQARLLASPQLMAVLTEANGLAEKDLVHSDRRDASPRP